MMTLESSINPRHLREKYQSWVGQKVNVGLTTFHYLTGVWKAMDGYHAVFTIGNREHRVLLHEIDNVSAASPAQAEYFK
jgi:hypothetical protein